MYRPVGRVGDMMACGAHYISTPVRSTFSSGSLILVTGAVHSHGGVGVAANTNLVFIEGMPAMALGDISPVCPIPHPHHHNKPLVTGDPEVFV